jgi:hypothetical protein
MSAADPPRIGLTTYREIAAWGVWNSPADLLPVSYAAGIAGDRIQVPTYDWKPA